MGNRNELFNMWVNDSKKFDGDLALFWAGRLSISANNVIRCAPINLSENLKLLDMCRKMYDEIIFSRTN